MREIYAYLLEYDQHFKLYSDSRIMYRVTSAEMATSTTILVRCVTVALAGKEVHPEPCEFTLDRYASVFVW